jgi:signal transduction histidine kinase
LNFARKEPLQYRQAVVDQIIWECLQLLEHRFKNIDLQLELGLQKPLLIDAEAVKQVVVNIMMNAAQAMVDGGSLRVHTSQKGEKIFLSFHDNGPGIPADLLNKIFDPFFTTKEVGEGTGLGLAVTYSQVERMGGTIEVESTEGEGALFTVKLPVRMGTGQEEKETA